jgi:hypothetical protein
MSVMEKGHRHDAPVAALDAATANECVAVLVEAFAA